LIAVDTPEALRRQLFGRQTVVHLAPSSPKGPAKVEELAACLRALPFVKHITALSPAEDTENSASSSYKLVISLDDPALWNPTIVQELVARGAQIRFVNELRHSLEDVYLSLMHNSTPA
jgi:ABC-2 type transport system ATP-binding protein